MVARFLGQKTNRAALEAERAEADARLAAARQAYEAAVAEYNEQKTTGGALQLPPDAETGAPGGLTDIDELKARRAALDKAAAAARLRLRGVKGSGDRLEDILVSVRAGASSLGGLLDTFREVLGPAAAPEAAVDPTKLGHGAAAAAAASAAFAAAAAAASDEVEREAAEAPGSPQRRPGSPSRQQLDVRRQGSDVLRLLLRCDTQLGALTDTLGRVVVEQLRAAVAPPSPPAPPPPLAEPEGAAFFITSVAEPPAELAPYVSIAAAASDAELLAALDGLVRAGGLQQLAAAAPQSLLSPTTPASPTRGGVWAGGSPGSPQTITADAAALVEALNTALSDAGGPSAAASSSALRSLSGATTRMLLADLVRAESQQQRGASRPVGSLMLDPREALLRMEAPAQLPGAENDLTLAAVTLGGGGGGGGGRPTWGGSDSMPGTPQQFLPTTPAHNVRVATRQDHARALAASLQSPLLQQQQSAGDALGPDSFALPPPASAAGGGAGQLSPQQQQQPPASAMGGKRPAADAAATGPPAVAAGAAGAADGGGAAAAAPSAPIPLPLTSAATNDGGGEDDEEDSASITRDALRHVRPSAALLAGSLRAMRASLAPHSSIGGSVSSPTAADAAALAALLPSSIEPGGGGEGDRATSPPTAMAAAPVASGVSSSAAAAAAASALVPPGTASSAGGGGLGGARRLRQSARDSSVAAAAATVAATSAGDTAKAAASALAATASPAPTDEGVLDRAALKRRAAELAQEEWRRREGANRAAAVANSSAAAARAVAAAAAAGLGSPPAEARRGSPLRGGGGGAPEPTGLGYLIQRPKLN